ncbi:MAG: epoxyqueuosine reductase [Myxococcota bacterium]
MLPDHARSHLVDTATSLGFAHVQLARVTETPQLDAFDSWLAQGHHADMDWLARSRPDRADPRRRLPTARTAIVLAVDHHHDRPADPGGRTGMVARYAWGRDYHNLVGKRIRKFTRRLRSEGISAWGGVDTAPILERAWAAAAGLGFTGKNTLLIRPGQTSWSVLGVVFVDLEATPDPPIVRDHCGSCTRCLTGCPTDAFPAPYELDARRCISYWTIEARGLPPADLRPAFGRWLFGCDVCQTVCPHNHSPPPSPEPDLAPRNAWIDLDDLLATPDEAVLARFLGTPLRRPGADGLKRNACIVLGNLGDDGAVPTLRTHAVHHSSPVVRAAAVWALARLGAPWRSRDPDPIVAAEQDALQD